MGPFGSPSDRSLRGGTARAARGLSSGSAALAAARCTRARSAELDPVTSPWQRRSINAPVKAGGDLPSLFPPFPRRHGRSRVLFRLSLSRFYLSRDGFCSHEVRNRAAFCACHSSLLFFPLRAPRCGGRDGRGLLSCFSSPVLKGGVRPNEGYFEDTLTVVTNGGGGSRRGLLSRAAKHGAALRRERVGSPGP